jgi:hypothetical protein
MGFCLIGSLIGACRHERDIGATAVIEISPILEERCRTKSDELMAQYDHTGPMPFVVLDMGDPDLIASYWNVEPSGDEFDDLARGVVFAELLVHRAKTWRNRDGLLFDPFRIISEVMLAIAKKGDPGAIERGFLSRIAMLALAGSLS